MAESIKSKVKKATKKAYKMPEKIEKGEILVDTRKNSWTLHNSIGVGGFGEIYAASKTEEPTKTAYAIKIEPHENGPLFCERSVYLNIGKKENIDEFIKLKKLKYLGFPSFYGFGSHIYKKVNYRFIVIEKLGKDVWSFFKTDKSMPFPTVMKIGIQILYVLEYMHSQGYVHCDVKGTNLLLGDTKGTENNVYLVDLGLACKFSATFSPNPKKAHNGTIEYTSRDAHIGAMTRRGDIEVLAYNLLHWATSRLPWEKLKLPSDVAAKKDELMKEPKDLIAACYGSQTPHDALEKFLTLVCAIEPTEEPPYKKLIDVFSHELKKLGSNLNKLEFENVRAKSPTKRKASPVKKREPSPVKKREVSPNKKSKTLTKKSTEEVKEKKSNGIHKVKKSESKSSPKNALKDADASRRLHRECKNFQVYTYSDESS